jgi:hypothetical protein
MLFIRTKYTGLIYENAEFLQIITSWHKKWRSNSPPLVGPGLLSQSQQMIKSLPVEIILMHQAESVNRVSSKYSQKFSQRKYYIEGFALVILLLYGVRAK